MKNGVRKMDELIYIVTFLVAIIGAFTFLNYEKIKQVNLLKCLLDFSIHEKGIELTSMPFSLDNFLCITIRCPLRNNIL